MIRNLYDDIFTKVRRDQYVAQLIRDLPGEFGIEVRRRWYSKKFKRCGDNLRIAQGAIILNPHKVECGDNVSIGVFNYLQAGGGLTLGSHVLLGPYVKIWTQNHRYKDQETPIRLQGYEYKKVEVGDDVWIGADAFVMPGTVIGDRCIVSARSVLGGKTYPKNIIMAGNPARKIGVRGEKDDAADEP